KSAKTEFSETAEATVLAESRRRCVLCFGLDHNLERKHGQIVYLDPDRSKCDVDNLAWMCLRHHGEFYALKRRHYYTAAAVREYRKTMYNVIAEHDLLNMTIRADGTGPQSKPEAVGERDWEMEFTFYTGAYSE